MKYKVINKSSVHFGKIGEKVDKRGLKIRLDIDDEFGPLWFGDFEVTKLSIEDEWAKGEFVRAVLDDHDVFGRICYVGENYLKIRITEGPNKNREIVRVPVDVSRDCVQEKDEYFLSYTNADGILCSKIFPYFDAMKEYVEKSLGYTNMYYQKIITRTERPKQIRVKTTYEF